MTRHPPVALVTGAGSGIGRALAVAAAGTGHSVILVGRRAAPLLETAALIGSDRVRIVAADVTRAGDRARIAESVGSRLDYLVNNAGQLTVGRLTDLGDAALADMVATNLTATLQLTRDLVPALAAAEGRIVNVGSMFGLIAFPYFAAYSATKFAMRGLSDALRRELAEYGISVTYVAPRATRTPAQSRFAHLVQPFGMALDTPERVARRAWAGVMAGKTTIYPGPAERTFALVQALAPALIDAALIRKARAAGAQAALAPIPEQKEA